MDLVILRKLLPTVTTGIAPVGELRNQVNMLLTQARHGLALSPRDWRRSSRSAPPEWCAPPRCCRTARRSPSRWDHSTISPGPRAPPDTAGTGAWGSDASPALP